MRDVSDDDNDIVNQLAYVRADPNQHDTATLLTMIDAAISAIIGLRMQLRVAQGDSEQARR
ncbi:hypothetical protein [Mesorhizobium sp.]|uniref:hypothetical protein n=1 Tax=Mesorhizobium sp. TaxID=1871066 RepID=UPI002600B6B0|nr:hypothetical protein [Mesorhizobium sp.]